MPNNAHTRRDPLKGKNGFSKDKGFTVIELMITIAVLAIVTSLALPSYRAIIEKRQVTSGAEQVMAFLSSAQAESVKRNQFVAVNYIERDASDYCYPDGIIPAGAVDWCFGFVAGDDAEVGCDCFEGTCVMDAQPRVLDCTMVKKPEVLTVASTSDAEDKLVFDPVRGLTQGAVTADVQLLSPDRSSYALNIEVSPTGRARICSDSDRANHSVPGYQECL